MKRLEKWFTIVLFALLLSGTFPKLAWAESVDEDVTDVQLVGEGDIVVGDGVTATFDKDTGTVTFYSDGGTLWSDWVDNAGISRYDIENIRVSTGQKVFLPEDSSYLFSDFKYLSEINMNGFDTSNVADMGGMFNNCSSLSTLNLSSFDTSNVTNMSYMFDGCSVLTILDLRSFDTSNVIGMSYMFRNCSSLPTLTLSNFDTSSVTGMMWMFYGCNSLNMLNLSGFDTSKVESMAYMFAVCRSLRVLDLSSFNTSNVTDMEGMFASCSSLTNLDLSSFDTSHVMNMMHMFAYCRSIRNLDLSGFNTSKVTNMCGMFFMYYDDNSRLSSLDLSGFDTSKVMRMDYMFYCCRSLTNLNLGGFDTSRVTDMASMFYCCSSLLTLDLSGFDAAHVTNTFNMISLCESLRLLKTPTNISNPIKLPWNARVNLYDKDGNKCEEIPAGSESITLVGFTDVLKASDWYYDSVYWAVENGITSGMGEGTFQPMAKLSRAQSVTFLYNLAGRPDVSGLEAKEFSDVPKSAWYYNAVKWAVANMITSGYGTGTFQPNATCNRAMIVTFLMNYAKAAGTYRNPTTSSNFKDVAANAWYKASVDWAVENGITSGYGKGTFSPNVTCNRAMMVTFLKKVAELPMAG